MKPLQLFHEFAKHHPVTKDIPHRTFCYRVQCGDCKIKEKCHSSLGSYPALSFEEAEFVIKNYPEYFI